MKTRCRGGRRGTSLCSGPGEGGHGMVVDGGKVQPVDEGFVPRKKRKWRLLVLVEEEKGDG